ncbi:membrane-spanning 4-domains subfamily A member 8-like isoform X2 [Erythrolamprus reginae]
MASGNIIVIPPNRENIIQMNPGYPGVPLQASGAIVYPQYGAQQLGIPTNAAQQVPPKGPLERFLNAEPKVLGAIQIMTGLIHIGFGAVSLSYLSPYYFNLSGFGGYPFWGGIFFISSGSVCVAAAIHPNPNLVKSSVGMNITSAVMASTGIILYVCEMALSTDSRFTYDNTIILNVVRSLNYGFSSVLLLFSILEFCITVSLAHFGCQAACCTDHQPVNIFVPYKAMGDEAVTIEQNPPPPPSIYNNMVMTSQ